MMPTLGLEGQGCWQWAVGWARVLSREAQQGNATDTPHPPQQCLPHPPFGGSPRAPRPSPPDLSLFIQHFHVVRPYSELSPLLEGN